jgi:hypothetical protein
MFVVFLPVPQVVDTYEEAVDISNLVFEETGTVVAVEQVAQTPLR